MKVLEHFPVTWYIYTKLGAVIVICLTLIHILTFLPVSSQYITSRTHTEHLTTVQYITSRAPYNSTVHNQQNTYRTPYNSTVHNQQNTLQQYST